MPARPEPSDGDLAGFLLGALPADRAEAVRAWLDADPARADHLGRMSASDPLTDAAADPTPDDPVPADAVERVVRRVADVLSTPREGSGDTSGHPGTGATVTYVPPSADDPAAVWPPARLGEYRVVRELGRGGMGVVFEVADEKLGRRVAAKVLAPNLARRPDAAARFLREARAAAAVEHDHVVPILHVGDDAGVAYIVMPLLRGESLADRLKRGAVADVARLGRDVAAGLAAAHARGLVHRDVKPANVWLDADTGRARVLDFGLALAAGDGGDPAELGAVMGTPAYMAPEQAAGNPATARSDLFALGVVLYECATGRRPFEGPTVTAILAAVREHHPPAPAEVNPAVPAALSDLVVRLLAKDPARRPAAAAEVLAALSAVPTAGGDSTLKWDGRPARPWRGRRGVWVAGGVVLAALVAAGVWLETRPRGGAETPPTSPADPPAPVRFRGKVDVLVERIVGGSARLLRLSEPGALPLRADDKFRVEGEVDPPAYLYVVWVDPNRDVTPVYPWDAARGWDSRPAAERPVGRVGLPPNAGERYTAPKAKPGVATLVLFARPTPLDVPDDVVKGWFAGLPDLPLPPGGDAAVVWFDDYTEARDPGRLRQFGVVGADDAFARWQGQLQKALGGTAQFQTAVSFARTGGK